MLDSNGNSMELLGIRPLDLVLVPKGLKETLVLLDQLAPLVLEELIIIN
jgi:hypothetical protein